MRTKLYTKLTLGPLALVLGATLAISACDSGPSNSSPGESAVQKAVISQGAVDPAAVGSGRPGDPASASRSTGGVPASVANQQLARVAKAIAKTLADQPTRTYVHLLASARFDGETTVKISQ